MYAALCYILLVIVSLYTYFSIKKIYRNTKSLILIIPILAIYFWSLYGAWTWIPFKLSGQSYFYEDMMFETAIDGYYFTSLLLYSLFLVVFVKYEKCYSTKHSRFLKKCSNGKYYQKEITRLVDSFNYKFIVFFFFFVFILFSYKDIISALRSGVSAYQLSRFDSTAGSFGSLSEFSGDTYCVLAIPPMFARSLRKKLPFLLSFAAYSLCNFLLGNRSILLTALLIAVLLYTEIYGVKKAFTIKNIILAFLLLGSIQIISIVRGLSVNAMFSATNHVNFSQIFMSLLSSSEQYASQISMYGVLKKNLDFTWGSSFLFLLSTLIPSFMEIPRPDRIYSYYIMGTVGHKLEMGVTIHHATAWYLNFGIVGIILGALLWGYTQKYFFIRKYNFVYMYGAILFSAISIQLIRDGGIEGYKGCLLLVVIIPLIIISKMGGLSLKKNRI